MSACSERNTGTQDHSLPVATPAAKLTASQANTADTAFILTPVISN